MVELGEHDAILHELPAAVCRHVHLRVIVCGVLSRRRGRNQRKTKRPQRQHDPASTQTHENPFQETHLVRPRICSDAPKENQLTACLNAKGQRQVRRRWRRSGGACPRTRRSDAAGTKGLGTAATATMEPMERPTGAALFAMSSLCRHGRDRTALAPSMRNAVDVTWWQLRRARGGLVMASHVAVHRVQHSRKRRAVTTMNGTAMTSAEKRRAGGDAPSAPSSAVCCRSESFRAGRVRRRVLGHAPPGSSPAVDGLSLPLRI